MNCYKRPIEYDCIILTTKQLYYKAGSNRGKKENYQLGNSADVAHLFLHSRFASWGAI